MSQRIPPCILVTCTLPWDESQRLMEQAFRRQIAETLRQGFNHIYIFGTAGEGYAVDTGQYRDVVRLFYEETNRDGVVPQVGVIGLSTAQVVERIGVAYDAGFRLFQISLPAWGELNDAELFGFFKDVCGTFSDCRFLHYNLLRARRMVTAIEYRRIADDVPNLVATKSTIKDLPEICRLMRLVPDLQHFFSEATFPAACALGPCSLLASFAAACPARTRELFQLGRDRQWDRLFEHWRSFLNMSETVLAPTRSEARIDGAYDKILARLGGHEMPMRLLSPYQAFTDEAYRECETIFREEFSEWQG